MKQLLKREKKKLVKPLLYLRLNIQMHDHCYWDFRDLCMSLLRFVVSHLRDFFFIIIISIWFFSSLQSTLASFIEHLWQCILICNV